jgi:hypothetical protein
MEQFNSCDLNRLKATSMAIMMIENKFKPAGRNLETNGKNSVHAIFEIEF